MICFEDDTFKKVELFYKSEKFYTCLESDCSDLPRMLYGVKKRMRIALFQEIFAVSLEILRECLCASP